ncbi:MAG: hypothetical protein ACUVUG_07815, partial [Candidatus Aminicenantia bacterium]
MNNEAPGSRKLTIIVLFLIILAGSFLRFFRIERDSLWNDELASWTISSKGSLNEVIKDCISDVHPPGYQILLYYFIKY